MKISNKLITLFYKSFRVETLQSWHQTKEVFLEVRHCWIFRLKTKELVVVEQNQLLELFQFTQIRNSVHLAQFVVCLQSSQFGQILANLVHVICEIFYYLKFVLLLKCLEKNTLILFVGLEICFFDHKSKPLL